MHIFQCMDNIFCVEFQRGTFESPHQISFPNIIFNIKIARALKFESLWVFLKHPPRVPILDALFCHELTVAVPR